MWDFVIKPADAWEIRFPRSAIVCANSVLKSLDSRPERHADSLQRALISRNAKRSTATNPLPFSVLWRTQSVAAKMIYLPSTNGAMERSTPVKSPAGSPTRRPPPTRSFVPTFTNLRFIRESSRVLVHVTARALKTKWSNLQRKPTPAFLGTGGPP